PPRFTFFPYTTLFRSIFFILIAANSSYAGEKDQSLQEPPPVKKEVTEEIFVVVEEQPEYPGGQEAMMKFLSDSIVYPEEAKAKRSEEHTSELQSRENL